MAELENQARSKEVLNTALVDELVLVVLWLSKTLKLAGLKIERELKRGIECWTGENVADNVLGLMR